MGVLCTLVLDGACACGIIYTTGETALRRIHFCAGLEESNGMAVAARFFAEEQTAFLMDVADADCAKIRDVDEVWVHSCWKPSVWRVCRLALKERKRLVRMVHGNLDPVRLRYHGCKKWLVGPIERFFLRRAYKIVATCEAEKGWIEAYLGKRCPKIEVVDVKRFFDLNRAERVDRVDGDLGSHKEHKVHNDGEPLHLMYLGRRHPLKGIEYLEEAVRQFSSVPSSLFPVPPQLKVVSNAFGEEKERAWKWCDVLVLPTLSENFGLVVAEALERGKRVITTDGAPAWGAGLRDCGIEGLRDCGIEGETGNKSDNQTIKKSLNGRILRGYGGRLYYLVGYREGSRNLRVQLLKRAIEIVRLWD